MMLTSVAKFSRPAMRHVLQATAKQTFLRPSLAGATTIARQDAATVARSNDFDWSGIQLRSFFTTPRTERSAPILSDAQVTDLFGLWNDALATLDPDTVAKRYAKTSVLLPTVSDQPRTDYHGIKNYFTDFLQKKPQGVILESNVIQGEDWAMDAGIYEFTMGATGDKVKARYTFVYQYEDGDWKITHHHSSVMPEAFLGSA